LVRYVVHHVHEKVAGLHLIVGHNFCKCRPFFKIRSLTDYEGSSYVLVVEISTSSQLRCYTTL